jgi:hypothetical protein
LRVEAGAVLVTELVNFRDFDPELLTVPLESDSKIVLPSWGRSRSSPMRSARECHLFGEKFPPTAEPAVKTKWRDWATADFVFPGFPTEQTV